MHLEGTRLIAMKISKIKTLFIIFLLSIFFLEGCVVLPLKRDFKKIFSPYLGRVKDNPVIIIPGIIGSRLVNTKSNKILWGSLRVEQIFFPPERESIALPIDKLPLSENRDHIVSKGIIDKYEFPIGIIQFRVYREILDMFEEVGYTFGDINNPQPGDNLYIFDYDWRRDNVETAKILEERIEDIKKKIGRPKQKFTLFCHSMGGLIGRYYMRYGGKDVLDQSPNFKVTWKGAKDIKRLILVAVPNLGSMPVFSFLHKGLDLMVVDYKPYVLFTMPSIYQLIPARSLKSFIDEDGNDLDIDLYDIKYWKKYGWAVYSERISTLIKSRLKLKHKDDWEERLKNFEETRDRFVKAALERAALFHNALSFKTEKKSPSEVVLFGGDTEWTIDKAIIKKEPGNKWRTYFWDPRLKEKILKPGDSMVTRESLLGAADIGTTITSWMDSPMDISFSLFVTKRHENIHKDATFQDNLLHILLD